MQVCVDWVLIIFWTQVLKKKRTVRPVFPDYLSFLMTMISSSLFIVIACIAWWERMEMLEVYSYAIIKSCILKSRNESLKPCMAFHDRIMCVMVCKIDFTNWNAEIALLRASIVVTYYVKLFRTGADIHNGILMSLLLVAETMINQTRLLNHWTYYLETPSSIKVYDWNCSQNKELPINYFLVLSKNNT